jgi:hypothetical protein
MSGTINLDDIRIPTPPPSVIDKDSLPEVVVPLPVPEVVVPLPVPLPVVPVPEAVVPVPVPEVVVPLPVVPVPEVVVPLPVVPVPTGDASSILEQVTKKLRSFLAGNKLTLANITGVVIDLYNFIESFKSLTTNQKSMMMIKVLTDFVKNEMDSDPTLLPVIDTLVPRIVETIVGVSNGTINVGEIIEDIEEKVSGCLSCFSKLFKK